jgi:hypothetical protein
MFSNPETTTGDRAFKFYASVRLDIRRIDSIKRGTDVVGSRVKVKVVKNKVAPPFRVAEFDILYAAGISSEGGLLDLGVELGLIKKAGAFLSYGDTRLGQGRENARDFLKLHPEIARDIDGQIRRPEPDGPPVPAGEPGGRWASPDRGNRGDRPAGPSITAGLSTSKGLSAVGGCPRRSIPARLGNRLFARSRSARRGSSQVSRAMETRTLLAARGSRSDPPSSGAGGPGGAYLQANVWAATY